MADFSRTTVARKTRVADSIRIRPAHFDQSKTMTNQNNRCLQAVLVTLLLVDVCSVANAADSIVEVADKTGKFKNLLAAVEAAGLADVLREDGPFTVFAPTDEAFAEISPNLLKLLLTESQCKDTLAKILKYHIISGKVSSEDAAQLHSAPTLVGAQIGISIRDGRLAINKANVVAHDVKASNGIIHVIDKVLMPERFMPNGRVLVFPAHGDIIDTAAVNSAAKHIFDADSEFRLLQRFDPALESTLKSVTGSTTTATFCNLAPKPIQVYWIGGSGKRKKWRGLIEPGALEICDRSFSGHVWLIADEHGKGLGLYILDNQNGLIVHK